MTIQGIFKTIANSTGDLTRFRHRGGNEEVIDLICKDVKQFLFAKQYLKGENNPNMESLQQLRNIAMFLILNTDFNTTVAIKEHEHLMNVMPKISKCILINLIVELELVECYVVIIDSFPLPTSIELFDEAIFCLRKTHSAKVLKHTFIIIREIIRKINSVDVHQVRDSVEKFGDVVTQLLMQISGFDPEAVQGWKREQLYKHIGYTILKLLKLLQYCDIGNVGLTRIVGSLIEAASSVARAITLNIYCSWAEEEHEGNALQIYVNSEACLVVEKYMKYEPAKELIQYLGPIAKKPKSVKELLRTATDDDIIKMINRVDKDQKLCFTTLLNTRIFHSKNVMECIEKWSHLSDIDDVSRMITCAKYYDNPDAKKLILKCASHLSVEDLTMTLIRYFNLYGFVKNLLVNNCKSELTLLLNRINQTKERNLSLDELESGSIKEIQLLLLQNPEEVIFILYSECIKNMVYTFWLKHCFAAIENVLKIDHIAVRMLHKAYKNDGPKLENLKGFIHLNEMLLDTGCISNEELFEQVIRNLLEEVFNEQKIEEFKCLLAILLELKFGGINNFFKQDFILFLLNALEKFRCQYAEFTYLNMEITVAITEIFKNLRGKQDLNLEKTYNPLNKFYVDCDNSLYLSYVFPDFTIDHYGDAVSKLIKLLSRCVSNEWLLITTELKSRFEAGLALEILTDSLILICQVTDTQTEANNPTIFNSLKYYLSSYGISAKYLQSAENSQTFEIRLIRNVLRLLPCIPQVIRFSEGVTLLTLLSEEALRSLAHDREFVCSLLEIKDMQLTQQIAKKMIVK